MATYHKYIPNVYLAKCEESHNKGEIIEIETKYGKINEHIIHNLIAEKNGFFYYSITRNDGLNSQDFAKNKLEKLMNASIKAIEKSDEYYNKSNEGREFLSLAEPIKIGHHSEKKHRSLIERNSKRMDKSMEFLSIASDYTSRAGYWEDKANNINLSMPESIEYYIYEVEKRKKIHEGLKNGNIEKSHSYSLSYAKKDLNESIKKLELANKLWG